MGRNSRALLEQREVPLAGAGFVAETGVLHDAPYWLEWWTANPDVGIESCRQLAADTDLASVGFRDYTDQHTLTVTQPVVVGSTFMGVVGVDLLAATVERLLGTDLDATEGVHVVVNRVGRVVASTDLEHVVGDLVHGLPGTQWFTGRRRPGDGDGSARRFVTCVRAATGRPHRHPDGNHRLTLAPFWR